MKKLLPHAFDDANALHELVNSSDAYLTHYLRHGSQPVLELYREYDELVRNPQEVKSHMAALPTFSHLMVKAYMNPPVALQALKEAVQDTLSPNVCPMCGSLKTGTADHYFPKDDFPEFSFFSKNLVPACDCNTKRGSTLAGVLNHEWIIHPFYEAALEERILTVLFDFSKGNPSLSIGKLYPQGIQPETIDFHVKNIHEKTTMLDWIKAEWAKLISDPLNSMVWYPEQEVSLAEVTVRVQAIMNANAKKLGTPNNWTSALYHGVYSSVPALEIVTEATNAAL